MGFTALPLCVPRPVPVYPHVRGVYACPSASTSSTRGSSPRAWGLRGEGCPCGPLCRFIPTYVGFTGCQSRRAPRTSVHPHVRGVYDRGGKPGRYADRFIPMCVGFTEHASPQYPWRSVHPHVCRAYTKMILGFQYIYIGISSFCVKKVSYSIFSLSRNHWLKSSIPRP